MLTSILADASSMRAGDTQCLPQLVARQKYGARAVCAIAEINRTDVTGHTHMIVTCHVLLTNMRPVEGSQQVPNRLKDLPIEP